MSLSYVDGTKKKKKTIESPSLGIKLGTTLGKISHLILGEAIIENDSIMRKNSKDFYVLVEMRWNDETARVSRTQLNKSKRNKPKHVPVTKDLQQLKIHLVKCRQESMAILVKGNGNVGAWRDLCPVC